MRLPLVGLALSVLACSALLTPEAMAQRRDRDRSQDWVQLGCQQVSFRGRDHDTIRVGRREGRFRAIRLAARGNDIEMRKLSVVYANGNPDELDVQRVIRSGSKTEPLDLKGRDRAIDRVDMVYRQRDDFRGRATVCVEGLVG
jgi:Protein of unknown function (DUF2541)